MQPLDLKKHVLVNGINFHAKTAKPLIPVLAKLKDSKERVVVSYGKKSVQTGAICQPPSFSGRLAFAGGAETLWMNEQSITQIATEAGAVLFDKKAA